MKRKENGQGLVEYAILVALLAIIVIAVMSVIGPKLLDYFDYLNGWLDSVESAGFVQGINKNGGNKLDSYKEFRDLSLDQEESLDEVRINLQGAVNESLEVLGEYADQIGDEVLYSLVMQAQQAASGDYANLPSTLEAVFSAIDQTPTEVLVATILKVEPNVIKSYWELDGAQVPYEAFEAALQEILQLEDQYPGSTGDAIPLMWDIWDTVAQRNSYIEEGQSAYKYIACMGITTLYNTDIIENIEIAQQFEAQLPPCEN